MEGRKTVTRRIVKPEPGSLELLKRWCKPRYKAGETVYVKEAWAKNYTGIEGLPIHYKLDYPNGISDNHAYGLMEWHSPMFLPEKYARTFLLIEDVRPERLKEITEWDAEHEGLQEWEEMYRQYDVPLKDAGWTRNPIVSYQTLWDSINPDCPFDFNPWIWRIQFKVKGISK
jgi:hypothetical protein